MPERLLIIGGPRTGKTTLAREMSPHFHESDLPYRQGKEWSECSAEVALWLDWPGPWVIEGVVLPRAIRKWLETERGRDIRNTPCDRVLLVESPAFVELNRGQRGMTTSVGKVWGDVAPELMRRGVKVERVRIARDPSKAKPSGSTR